MSHVQRIVRLAAAALLQAAVQTLLQVVAQRGDDLHGCIGFELPVQAVGGHAQGTGGIDRRRVVLAEPGDQPGAD
ncbi:hypothetical protein D3C71_1275830 [compost metagenome]